MMTLVLLDVASKAARMAEQDPNGWIMTLVAVCVVFLTLFLLQYCYRFVGWLSNRKKKASKTVVPKSKADDEVAAAIATALSMETSGEIQAVIGLALDRWFSESIHDKESYVITIKRKY